MDYGDQIDVVGDQVGCGVEVDVVDGGDWQVQVWLGLVEQFDVGGGGVGFGVGIEEVVEGDVVGVFGYCLFGQFQLGVVGGVDDCLVVEQGVCC